MRVLHMVTASATLRDAGAAGRFHGRPGPTVPGCGSKAGPAPSFWFFNFVYNSRKSYKVLKCVENVILLGKFMKQISIESLRVDLGIRLDKSLFCTLLHYVKLLQLQP
jgi:hypothetical protein